MAARMVKQSLEKIMSWANLHKYSISMTRSSTFCASQLSETSHLVNLKVLIIALKLMRKRLRRSRLT